MFSIKSPENYRPDIETVRISIFVCYVSWAMTASDRTTILDAVNILNDLFHGLVAGTMVFEHYRTRFANGEFSNEGIVSVQKMCISHLVLSLCKLSEFWESFHSIVPDEFRPELKKLVSKIDRLGVKEYRNTIVAHVKDRKLGRARTQLESIDILNQISENNPQRFLRWLNDPNNHDYPDTVVSVVTRLRDNLLELHQVTAEEALFRWHITREWCRWLAASWDALQRASSMCWSAYIPKVRCKSPHMLIVEAVEKA